MTIADKLAEIANRVPEVYEAGTEDMVKKVTDMITANNTRTNYNACFQNSDLSGFEFAYPLKVTGAVAQMFYNSQLTKLPTPIDWSELATITTYDTYAYRRSVFAYCGQLKEIDLSPTGFNMRAIGGIEEWFMSCRNLETIKGLNVNENTICNNAFNLCDKLVNLSFADGSVIGKSLDLHWSKNLSFMSLDSVLGALSKTVTGQTITFPTTARETYDNATIGGRWDERVTEYPNWTFAYA